ncbi:MAG: AAA domain-containing protein, partial [Bacteroidota bacterium]
MSQSSREKLARLKEILEIERQADLEQYRNMVLRQSLQDRVKQGVTWYPVQLRHVGVGLGERIVLQLDRPEGGKKKGGTFQVGSVVSVFGKQTDRESGRTSGVISRLREDHMHVMLSAEYLPDWATDSKLGVDLDFDDRTYQEMQQALSQVIDPDKSQARITELRETLVGERAPDFHQWNIEFTSGRLNKSQNRAIQRILTAQDVAIIHGPPGTGKTTTLVEAIKETCLHEHQVLVCAASNTAVDLLTLRCLEAGLEVLRLGNPARVEEELQLHTLDGSITQHPDYQALRKLRKDAEEARKQAAKYKRKYGNREQQRRRDLYRDARELKTMAHKLEDYIVHQLVNHTQVIACTLTGAAAKVLGNKRFHTVFIDEAAQALEPACWIPILRSNRVIMAGDHCQLPPTVKSPEAGRQGLSNTLFEQVIAKKQVDVMLEQQYRMHEQIMRFSGRQFYHNRLIADASVKNHLIGPKFPPLTFIDTAGCGFSEVKNPQSLSTGNPEEANLVLLHLAMLFNQINSEAPDTLERAFKVGLVTPYKEQVRLLQRQLLASPMLSDYADYVDINTVDGFQGQEREVIYISLVRTNEKGKIGFLSDIRRMNVALTRARKKLVVVGDSSTLGDHPFYQAFLDYV